MTEDIPELTKAAFELDAAMAKSTSPRNKEKTNTATISDAQEAAVAQALTPLKEFYATAVESTAFAQTKDPEIFEDEYMNLRQRP